MLFDAELEDLVNRYLDKLKVNVKEKFERLSELGRLEELKSTLKTKLGSLLEKNSVDKITEEVEKTFYGEAVEVINKMLNA